MKDIVLIGFMGSGKTTIGYKLSQELNKIFIDCDNYIEQISCKTINEIFADSGEDFFRNIESDSIKSLINNNENCIIATGGGCVKNEKAMNYISDKTIIIYLKSSIEHIYNNIKDATDRPLLKCNDVYSKIENLFNERKDLYEKYAHFSVEVTNKTVEEIVTEIISILEANNA